MDQGVGWSGFEVWGSLRWMLMHCDGCIAITGPTVVDGVGVNPGTQGVRIWQDSTWWQSFTQAWKSRSLLLLHGTLNNGNHERRSKNPGKSFVTAGLNKKISSLLTPSPP